MLISGAVVRVDNTEATLASKTGPGETIDFSGLVDKYQNRLYNTVLHLVGDPNDALDVLQDAFLRAYKSFHQFRGRSKLYTWLYRIAVNTALSFRQSAATRLSRSTVSLDNGYQNEGSQRKREVSDGKYEASESVRKKEIQDVVTAAIAELEPELRAAVVLRDIEELNYEDIAGILGIPKGTVKSRLHRARLELKEKLREFV